MPGMRSNKTSRCQMTVATKSRAFGISGATFTEARQLLSSTVSGQGGSIEDDLMKPVRGVLLDIDGTLVASNDAHAHAWVKALAESGRKVAFEIVRPLIGMGGDKLLPKVCGLDAESEVGQQISDRRAAIFLKEYL